MRVKYHESPGTRGDDMNTSYPHPNNVNQSPHVRFAPRTSGGQANPHVRFAPGVSAEQAETNDTEAGFDDTGPEPTDADIQRAARVSAESTDYVVPEPGTITVDRELTFDDSSEDGGSTGDNTLDDSSEDEGSTGGVSTGDKTLDDSSEDEGSTGGVSTGDKTLDDSSEDEGSTGGVSTGDKTLDDSSEDGGSTDGSEDAGSTGGVSTGDKTLDDGSEDGGSTGGIPTEDNTLDDSSADGVSTGDKDNTHESSSGDDSESTTPSTSEEDGNESDGVFDYAEHCEINDKHVVVTEDPVCSLSHVAEHPFTIGKETFWTMYHWISASAAYVMASAQGKHAWRITRHNKAHRGSIMINPCPLQAKRHLDAMESTNHSLTTWLNILNDVLEYGLLLQFATHPELKSFLVSTGDKNIVYKSNTESLNEASGRALMAVRHHFSKGSEKTEFARVRKSVHHMLQWKASHSRHG
ncbi:unnamed protein product [Ectocarpus sp. 6 AP-2014]